MCNAFGERSADTKVMANKIDSKDILYTRGLRLTPQRRTILDVMATQEHPMTAEAIYEQAKQLNPHISLATVYRTLTALVESGLVQQRYRSVDHDRLVFELSRPHPLIFFHCRRCGKFFDMMCPDSLLAELKTTGEIGHVMQICACIEGYCRDCQASEGCN
jgi:Fe2+ or Zn2+ uptake regulation protein